jgi:hypothetical protein
MGDQREGPAEGRGQGMSFLDSFPATSGAQADASARLDRAERERDQSVQAVRACGIGPGAALAAQRLARAEDKVAGREAWLAWVELGD